MRPLSTLYGARAPFTTAYLEPAPADPEGVSDRWRALADEAIAAGAEEEDLDAMEEVIASSPSLVAAGRVLVAAQGRVLLADDLPAGARARVVTGLLPDLFDYVARRLRVPPNLVLAPVDGTVRVLRAEASGFVQLWPREPQDGEFRRAFARAMSQTNPEVVVVVGDYAECRAAVAMAAQARVLPPDVALHLADADPHDPRSVTAAAQAVLRRQLRPVIDEARRAVTARGAAIGPVAVVEALRMAQVSTIVVGAAAQLPERCWIGPRPTEFGLRDREAARFGVTSPQYAPFDAALVRAVAATTVRMIVLQPGEEPPPGGIAAALRY